MKHLESAQHKVELRRRMYRTHNLHHVAPTVEDGGLGVSSNHLLGDVRNHVPLTQATNFSMASFSRRVFVSASSRISCPMRATLSG